MAVAPGRTGSDVGWSDHYCEKGGKAFGLPGIVGGVRRVLAEGVEGTAGGEKVGRGDVPFVEEVGEDADESGCREVVNIKEVGEVVGGRTLELMNVAAVAQTSLTIDRLPMLIARERNV